MKNSSEIIQHLKVKKKWPLCTIYIKTINLALRHHCSITKSCPTICDSMDCSTSDFPVLHWVCSNSCPMSQWYHPSHLILYRTLNLSQHQGLFQRVGSLYQVARVLELQLQHQVLPVSIQDWFPLGLTGLISLPSKGLSRVFSNTTVQKHQFFSAQSSLWSNSHIHTWLLEKP